MYYEELKDSIHEGLEQKRKLKFEQKVKVQDIPLTGKKGRCEKDKVDRQHKRVNAEQVNINKELLEAFEKENLVSAKELVRKVKNLNTLYQVHRVALPLLLRLFVANACKGVGWFEFYKDVLSEGGKINLNTDVCSSGTALSYACRERNSDVVELLLEHGADVNKVGSFSVETPILIALKNNDYNLANLLFQHGAKIDVTPKLEEVIAANSCNRISKYTKETMEVLLQYTSPRQNTSMLMYFSNNETSTNEDIEIVKLLLEKGADLTVKNTNGKTCKDLAAEKGNTGLIDLFNQKLGIELKSLEDSFIIIPDNLTLEKIQSVLNYAVNENSDAELIEVMNNIQDYESQFICNFDNPEEAESFMKFSKKVLNLQSQVRDQHVNCILMVLRPQENGSRYSVKELLLLAIAADDELTEKYQDVLFAEENLSLLHLIVGSQRYIEIFTEKFTDTYQSFKNQIIQLQGSEIGFFSVIAIREEQELLDKVFVNEDALQDLKEILQNNASDPVYGVLEAASLVQNEKFIKKVLDAVERDAKQNINTKTLLKKSCITLLEAAVNQERLSVVEHLCKKCSEDKNEVIQIVYTEAFADDKVIETFKKQILKSIGVRGRREVYNLMLKTASSTNNIAFMEKVLDLVKGDKQLLRESLTTISENSSIPTTIERLQKYINYMKDVTKFTEVPSDIKSGKERQKALEKCLESRISHKYSEFQVIENGGNIQSSCNGWSAKRRGVDFFIKPLNVSDNYSVQSFITEIIAGPLYRLALFGKSPKIWLIKDDKNQIYLGSEFLPNFNTFADLFKRAVTKSEINTKNCLEEQVQHKFKGELQKSAGSSRQFAKFLAACLIFREFDFNLGNFGIIEVNDTGIAERKWAKIDHGLSFEYSHLFNISGCSELLKFYLQDRKQCKDRTLDRLLKEVLAELVDYNELSEELGNICKFLEESKALIEQLIDKQVKDLEEALSSAQSKRKVEMPSDEILELTIREEDIDRALSECHCINVTIGKETFLYDTERRTFLNGRGSPLNKCFKEMLYDQIKKAKEFSEKLSKENKDLKMKDLSLGYKSSGNMTRSSVRDNSSKAYPEVVVTENNNSNSESKKTVASSIQQARIDDLIQGKNQLGKEPNSIQGNLDRKIAELKNRKTFIKEGKNDTLSIVRGLTQNFISHNFMEGKMHTNIEQQVKSSLGQGELEDIRNQLEKLQKELGEKISKEAQLTEERNQLNGQLNSVNQELEKAKNENKELKNTIQELITKNTVLEDQNKKLEALKIQNKQSESQIEGLKTQLNNKNKELDDTNQKAVHLEHELNSIKRNLVAETSGLDEAKARLKYNERKLNDVNKNILKLREGLKLEKSNQQVTVNNLNGEITQLTQALKKTKKHLKESESKNKELNEKFLEAVTNSKRQGNYASVSFISSGAFAVGASLTIPYLAICIAFAIATLFSLAVGCYCLHKANTVLSNVEVKNGIDPTAVEV